MLFFVTKYLFNLLIAIICRTLPNIPNGFITYALDTTPDNVLGTVATYACNPGFVLDLSPGVSEMRTCVDDMDNDAEGVFDPRCVRKSYTIRLSDSVQSVNAAVCVYKVKICSCIAQGVFLSFQGTTYTMNNSNIVLTRIETTNDTSLTCHTDSTTCCRGIDNGDSSSLVGNGEWLFPDGTSIVRRKRVLLRVDLV